MIPGVFFLIYGCWWCFISIWLYLQQKNQNKDSSSSSSEVSLDIRDESKVDKNMLFLECEQNSKLRKMSWIPAPFLSCFPSEPFLKILLPLLGIFVEGFLNYDKHHHLHAFVYHIRMPNGQLNDLGKFDHIILYFGFLLSGLVDVASLCLKLPSPTSTIFLSLSFFVEGLLFYFHTKGREDFNIVVHLLLVYIIVSCFVFTLMRLLSPSSVVINLGLGSSILFQGTWLIQIGYFLFGDFLSKDEVVTHEHTILATGYFAWHLFLISIAVLFLLVVLSLVVKNKEYVLKNLKKTGKSRRLRRVGWKSVRLEECSSLIEVEDDQCSLVQGVEMTEVKDSRP